MKFGRKPKLLLNFFTPFCSLRVWLRLVKINFNVDYGAVSPFFDYEVCGLPSQLDISIFVVYLRDAGKFWFNFLQTYTQTVAVSY